MLKSHLSFFFHVTYTVDKKDTSKRAKSNDGRGDSNQLATAIVPRWVPAKFQKQNKETRNGYRTWNNNCLAHY